MAGCCNRRHGADGVASGFAGEQHRRIRRLPGRGGPVAWERACVSPRDGLRPPLVDRGGRRCFSSFHPDSSRRRLAPGPAVTFKDCGTKVDGDGSRAERESKEAHVTGCMAPRWRSGREGFTLPELLVGAAIVLVIMAGIVGVVDPGHAASRAQPAAIDIQQRLRAASESISADILGAGSGPMNGVFGKALGTVVPTVLPYRVGPRGDAPGTVRTDAITLITSGSPHVSGRLREAFVPSNGIAQIEPGPGCPVGDDTCGLRAGGGRCANRLPGAVGSVSRGRSGWRLVDPRRARDHLRTALPGGDCRGAGHRVRLLPAAGKRRGRLAGDVGRRGPVGPPAGGSCDPTGVRAVWRSTASAAEVGGGRVFLDLWTLTPAPGRE